MAFALASVTALTVPIVRAAGDSPAATDPQPLGITCVQVVDEDYDDDYCHKRVADLAQRTEITEAQRTRAEALLRQVVAALPGSEPGEPSCDGASGICSLAYTAPSPDTVRRALVAAGYQDAVVYLAGRADPAPLHSVVVAVPFGSACVLVYLKDDSSSGSVTGQLPGGRCLAP